MLDVKKRANKITNFAINLASELFLYLITRPHGLVMILREEFGPQQCE
jgi:hypothetical protein